MKFVLTAERHAAPISSFGRTPFGSKLNEVSGSPQHFGEQPLLVDSLVFPSPREGTCRIMQNEFSLTGPDDNIRLPLRGKSSVAH